MASEEPRGDRHVPLERSHGQQNVHASDEDKLQFHQPDEQLSEENVIPDPARQQSGRAGGARRELMMTLSRDDPARCRA